MKKSLVQLAFNQFHYGTSKTHKPRFQIPDLSLVVEIVVVEQKFSFSDVAANFRVET